MALTKRRQSRGVRKSRRVKTSKKSRRTGKGRKGMRKNTKRKTHRKYQRGGVEPEGDCFDPTYYYDNEIECRKFMNGLR